MISTGMRRVCDMDGMSSNMLHREIPGLCVCECVCLGEKGKLLQSFSTEGKTQFLCFLNPLMHKFDTLDTFNVSTHFLHSGQRCHVEIKIKS